MSLRPALRLALAAIATVAASAVSAPLSAQAAPVRAAPIPQPASANAAPGRPPDLLWELPATAPCRLSLVHPDGAVDVVVGGKGARLLGEAHRWQVAVAESGDPTAAQLRLTVRRGDGPEAGAAPDLPPVLLEVPAGCDLAIQTGAGEVDVRGSQLGRLAAESATGDITLWVPPSVEPAVEVATSGEITVDFSITIEYLRHQEPEKLGRIEPGAGASWAQLRSRQGSIRVLQGHAGHSSNDLP